ncbi:hypothetical protein HDU97_009203 [Phlyctochytrium planicorne]|nr:hypothetical protein HDU97_009203 [Phlyctochytrium planicorne]
MEDKHVRVFIRVRPLEDSKIEVNNNCVKIANERNPNESFLFNFEKVLDADSTQEDVFNKMEWIVDKTLEGKNGTIFAYGQTGAGKTHSG